MGKEGTVKRGLFVVLTAALALWLSSVTAAAAEWCSDDPAIHFRDGTGHVHTVYLTTYGDGVEHTHAVRSVAYVYGVRYRDHGRSTQLNLRVFVPDDSKHHFHVRYVVSTGPGGTGKVLGRHDGDSGQSSGFSVDVPI